MKTLENIKDEVAKKSYGCDHWDEFYIENKEYPKELSAAFEEVVRKCVHQALDEAAEEARIRTNDESTSLIVDKESILKLKEKY